MKRTNVWLGMSAAAMAVAACGSYPIPTERMVASEAALRGAQEVGAESSPQAPLHLKLAQEQIAQAKSLIASGDNERADYVLIRAKADAELALALAREASAQADAKKAIEQASSMQKGGE